MPEKSPCKSYVYAVSVSNDCTQSFSLGLGKMSNQSPYHSHPDFHSDVQRFQSVLTAHMNEFAAGRHPNTSDEISKFLETLASKGYSSEQIGAIQQEALSSILKAVLQRMSEALSLHSLMVTGTKTTVHYIM